MSVCSRRVGSVTTICRASLTALAWFCCGSGGFISRRSGCFGISVRIRCGSGRILTGGGRGGDQDDGFVGFTGGVLRCRFRAKAKGLLQSYLDF